MYPNTITAIAQSSTQGDTVRIPPVLFQPIAADDVTDVVSEVAAGAPLNGRIEIAGPDRFRFDELIRDFLRDKGDAREVVGDARAPYFGAELSQYSLVPVNGARLGKRHLTDRLEQSSD